MNERAREALVDAALRGVPQIKGVYTLYESRCAVGVLYDAVKKETGLKGARYDVPCGPLPDNISELVMRWAEMTEDELEYMICANDDLGWDFLTIARKIGMKNIPQVPREDIDGVELTQPGQTVDDMEDI